MQWVIVGILVALMLESIVAPPVIEKKEDKKDEDKEKNARFEDMGIEYNRYLVQVVEALESDPDFRKKLENATSEDIQSGNIAHELDFVSHNVRTKLDELKRIELERLRKLARQEYELENDIDTTHMKIDPGHVDHTNPHTFEIADLKKLIAKTSEDLAEADKKRREEFKTYEMEKEFEKQQKLKELDEEKRKKYLEELEQQKLKHKQHDPVPLHHPGSKQQLEEVWEKQDHMEQEFDPKAFFFMHDLDGNGVWDEAEVKALFLKELDKLYQAGAPEDDMRERAEEMERMREHVFREADLNHDNLISFQEFLAQTKKPEFERDPGWEPLDEQQIYTQDEYLEFERQRQQEIERLIREGKLQPPPVYHPPPPNYYPPQGYHPNQVPYQQQPQAYQQQQVHQQQQHYQQQQQNVYQQQQQYHQQNPPHYQQQQYQQQPVVNNQQQQQQQQPIANNQQQPMSNNIPQQQQQQQQPVVNSVPQQQQPVSNSIPQQHENVNNIQQQQVPNNIPQQPMGNNIPQQPMGNNIPQQPMGNNIPQQPLGNNIPQQPLGNNIPQQPQGNNIPPQGNPQMNIPQQNIPVNTNNIPKVPHSGPVLNSIPQGPK